ncbi:MAG TPA: phycobilisome rod-core linker polypeptide [Vicinamibacterales bacterium]
MWRASVVLATILLVPAVPARAQSCTSNAGEIVDRVYRQILEREPDRASSEFVQQLASGHATVRQLVAELAASPEHRARLWEPVVESTFRQVRNAAPQREQVQSVARNLAEGRQTLDDAAIAFAAEEVQSQAPETAVVAMYRRLLGRDPSEGDVAHFTQRLQREGPQAVATTIVTSSEYRERFGRTVPAQGTSPYEAPVRMLYRHLLGRDADPQGLAQFTRVARESGFEAAIDQIMASPEYREKYGEQGVPGGTQRYCGRPLGTTGR